MYGSEGIRRSGRCDHPSAIIHPSIIPKTNTQENEFYKSERNLNLINSE